MKVDKKEGRVPPKVFISYSWTNEAHEQWVIDLATRLREDGIDAKLDKWDLTVGQDKYKFMEQMATDPKINHVLMICDTAYKKKADERKGGVGAETLIITPEIYDKAEQTKFIPVIAEETDGPEENCLPAYLKSRIYIDLSKEDTYENEYEKLLRKLFNRPENRKPELGQPPAHIFEEEQTHSRIQHILLKLEHAYIETPTTVKRIKQRFLNALIEDLEAYRIDKFEDTEENPYYEVIYNKIHDMIGLRDLSIEYIKLLCDYEPNKCAEEIIYLFQNLLYLTDKPQGISSWVKEQFNHYQFYLYELFIYMVSILIQNGMFTHLSDITSSMYYFYDDSRTKTKTFSAFRFHIRSLKVRNTAHKSNRVCSTADLLIERAGNKNIIISLVEADTILYYISIFLYGDEFRQWVPILYIYEKYQIINLFAKMISESFFNKVKILFSVNDINEFLEKLDSIYSSGVWIDRVFQNSFASVPRVEQFIKREDIGKYR